MFRPPRCVHYPRRDRASRGDLPSRIWRAGTYFKHHTDMKPETVVKIFPSKTCLLSYQSPAKRQPFAEKIICRANADIVADFGNSGQRDCFTQKIFWQAGNEVRILITNHPEHRYNPHTCTDCALNGQQAVGLKHMTVGREQSTSQYSGGSAGRPANCAVLERLSTPEQVEQFS